MKLVPLSPVRHAVEGTEEEEVVMAVEVVGIITQTKVTTREDMVETTEHTKCNGIHVLYPPPSGGGFCYYASVY
jgi:hypothetical protein